MCHLESTFGSEWHNDPGYCEKNKWFNCINMRLEIIFLLSNGTSDKEDASSLQSLLDAFLKWGKAQIHT